MVFGVDIGNRLHTDCVLLKIQNMYRLEENYADINRKFIEISKVFESI